MSGFDFLNSTHLDDARLLSLCREAVVGWSIGCVAIRFRYTRSTDFSGSCHYRTRRIFVNIGRHLVYPYRLTTHVGRARTEGRRWYKPRCFLDLSDEYQLAMFIFAHELYHLLVKRAKRNTRQKESMCDRFATRFILQRFGGQVLTDNDRVVPREHWDFQDLDRFVQAARTREVRRPARAARVPIRQRYVGEQLLLFPFS